MRDIIFRQYDNRWSKLGYPTKSSSFRDNGCGCCACTHLIIEKDEYKDYTPKNVRKYMVAQGFAIESCGTTWSGITKTLEHYGFDVVKPNIACDMDEAWEELNKGNRAGILLFSAGSRGGTTWTSGGHYVAFTAYKVVKGKHWFYTKDSGARHNDGWHCYEDEMRGLLPQMWIVKLPVKEKAFYTKGKTYTLQHAMKVRTGAGTNYKQKKRADLTADGKKNAKKGTYAVLKKGTRVTCQKVITLKNGNVWMKIPSGYVCAKGQKTTYIK